MVGGSEHREMRTERQGERQRETGSGGGREPGGWAAAGRGREEALCLGSRGVTGRGVTGRGRGEPLCLEDERRSQAEAGGSPFV